MTEFTREQLAAATPEELEYALRLMRAQTALKSPLDYALYCTPGAQKYAHTVYLNMILMALVEKRLYKSGPGPVSVLRYRNSRDKKGQWVHPETGEPVLHRVMISLPPQVGKSFIVGEHFTPWYMRTHPDENIMYITYASPLAEKISRRAMATIDRTPELGTKLDPDRKSIKNWAIDGGMGEFLARGVTGSVTGFGGNVIFDDPHADGEAAMSEIERNSVLTLWDSSVATRTGGGFKWAIVVQTRWHHDDLSGHLQKTDLDKWFVVVLPALAYDTVNEEGISIHPEMGLVDPLGRKPGESVCPELFAEEDFHAAKKRDPFWFDAEYQGLPSSLEGALFQSFNHYIFDEESGIYTLHLEDGTTEYIAESDCVRYGIMDCAILKTQTADYTVFGVFDRAPNGKLLLRHIERQRVGGDKLLEFLYANTNRWGCEWVGIEDVTHGTVLIQNALAENRVQIRRLKPKNKDKAARAAQAAMLMTNGLLWTPQAATWRADFEDEVRHFKGHGDAHDDQVDVLSYGAIESLKIHGKVEREVEYDEPTDMRIAHRRFNKNNRGHDEVGSGW